MRNGEGRVFYTPIVWQLRDGEYVPLPVGLNTSHKPDGIIEFDYTQQQPYDLPYTVQHTEVLDPRSMPIAIPKNRYPADVEATEPYEDRQFNALQNYYAAGLHVEPLRNIKGRPILPARSDDDHTHQVVTRENLKEAWTDCNGEKIIPFDNMSLATCKNLNDAIDIIRIMFDQFKQEITNMHDGSGATTSLVPDANNAGPGTPADTFVPFTVGLGTYVPYGTSNEDGNLQAPKFYFDPAAVTPGEVIAIDVYNVSGGANVYQGTFYRSASGLGYNNLTRSGKASFIIEELARPGFLGDVLKDRAFVLRKLRGGESAVNVKPMSYGAL